MPEANKSDNPEDVYFKQLIHISDLYKSMMDKMNTSLGRLTNTVILDRISKDPERKEYPNTILKMIRFATKDKNFRIIDDFCDDYRD